MGCSVIWHLLVKHDFYLVTKETYSLHIPMFLEGQLEFTPLYVPKSMRMPFLLTQLGIMRPSKVTLSDFLKQNLKKLTGHFENNLANMALC